ncbi:uncharacterized protein MELLADRAFT_91661 [Melampsora larici-populina 98AG31]|uniref:SWIM-type domain-containing protein n=1 Tax=Melampsora larici-populina (strain 98AG31 / pathotype 3-4-7) TaxID=747676 RepID=F4RZU9_MELLP|nr:uncharacterized protein MELLADRAFT_91661 [Melampsora larici-populina 98AG31]EGG02124.1 hypothetical protein MELLADRAFT_91661 [Melampsora larici-populina 98AG31]
MAPDRSARGNHQESTPYSTHSPTSSSNSSRRYPIHERYDPHPGIIFLKPPSKRGDEKRLGSWRSSSSIKVQERIWRAIYQDMYILDHATVVSASHKEFAVSGTTYYVFKVIINQLPSCTCPDWRKGYICKHILFVFIKVLKVPLVSPWFYQKALLTKEVERIFSKAPEIKYPVDPIARRLWNAYAAKKRESQTNDSEEVPSQRRPIEEGDECPICYENLPCNSTQGLVFCVKGCGKGLHEHCVQDYVKTLRNDGKKVICVYCRADWKMPGSELDGSYKGGYVNLGRAAGLGYVYPHRYAPQQFLDIQRNLAWTPMDCIMDALPLPFAICLHYMFI